MGYPVRSWLLALGMVSTLSGCAYTNISMPLDTDLDNTILGDKVGRSQFHSFLGIVAWGDAGIQAAARDGGLEVLHHADREVFNVLMGLYFRQTTVVYGE